MSQKEEINGKDVKEMDLFMSFRVSRVSRYKLAFNVQKIKEVVECTELTNLPEAYKPFVGVYDLRGMVVPVMDLSLVLASEEEMRAEREEGYKNHRIMICDVQGYLIGLVVSRTEKILNQRNMKYLPTPKVFDEIDARFINGILKTGGEIMYLLDIEYILDSMNVTLDKTRSSHVPEQAYSGRRVFLVEDSKLFQKRGQQLFTKLGFEVVIAENGKEAWEILHQESGRFDLIFLDIEMPLMNGIEFARLVKNEPKYCQIPIVFNSSLSNPGLIKDIRDENLGGYIVKYDEALILTEVRKALGEGSSQMQSAA